MVILKHANISIRKFFKQVVSWTKVKEKETETKKKIKILVKLLA